MLTADEFYALLTKYTNDQCTEEEERSLFHLMDSGRYSDVLSAHFDATIYHEKSNTLKMPPDRAEEIMKHILHSEKQTVSLIATNEKRVFTMRNWWASAAAVVILFFGAYLYYNQSSASLSIKEVASLQNDPQLLENRTSHPVAYTLEDGSKILLQPGAILTCPKHFSSDKREVYLEGEAFFEINKNPGRPFLVYHNNLITQVLGTSFSIKVNKDSDVVEVNVVTGRVQVSEWVKDKQSNNLESNGVIVTPNQKAIYNNESRQFATALVDVPLPVIKEDTLLSSPSLNDLVFENAPLPEVLSVLKNIYNVDIIVENANLSNCFFTGDLSNPNLYFNLNLIATVTNAVYEVKGTNILLKGNGCANH